MNWLREDWLHLKDLAQKAKPTSQQRLYQEIETPKSEVMKKEEGETHICFLPEHLFIEHKN